MRRGAGLLSKRDNVWLVIVAGLVAVGVSSEIASAGGSLADLIVGLVIGLPAVVVCRRRRRDPVGWLLVLASLLWFAGTVLSALRFVHRGALLLAVVAPSVSRRSGRAVALVLLAAACAVGFGRGATSTALLIVVAGLMVAVAIAGLVRGVVVPWRAAWVAALPATVLWVSAATISRTALDGDTRLRGYQIGVAFAGLAMAISRNARSRAVDEVTDVGRASGLGGALGDPTMRLGFEEPDGSYRAADGSIVMATGVQVLTEFDFATNGRARVVHRAGLLDDERVRRDVAIAARLLAEHRQLTREVQANAVEVRDSRARLIVAGDRASTSFAGELDRRVIPHLDTVLNTLEPGDHKEMAVGVRTEIAALAAGSAPSQLDDGLPAALLGMARNAPIATEVQLDEVDLNETQARTLYFVAAEGLSNAIKHSGAKSVQIGLRAREGGVELRVDDDGIGDIVLRPGGGLMGLSDRLASLGGTLDCGGSSVAAWLPVS